MSSTKKLIRQQFRDAVFERDNHKCRTCGIADHMVSDDESCLDAHHITDRTLMPNGGYVKTNGISLCLTCHQKAEVFHSTGTALSGWAPADLYALIGSSFDLAVNASKKLSN